MTDFEKLLAWQAEFPHRRVVNITVTDQVTVQANDHYIEEEGDDPAETWSQAGGTRPTLEEACHLIMKLSMMQPTMLHEEIAEDLP